MRSAAKTSSPKQQTGRVERGIARPCAEVFQEPLEVVFHRWCWKLWQKCQTERHRFQTTSENRHLQSRSLGNRHGFQARVFVLVVEVVSFPWDPVDLCFPVHIRGSLFPGWSQLYRLDTLVCWVEFPTTDVNRANRKDVHTNWLRHPWRCPDKCYIRKCCPGCPRQPQSSCWILQDRRLQQRPQQSPRQRLLLLEEQQRGQRRPFICCYWTQSANRRGRHIRESGCYDGRLQAAETRRR